MLALSDRFFWPRLYSAMIVYKTTRNVIKFIPAYSLAILIFLAGNLGVRMLGLVKIRELKKTDPVNIILWVIALLGFIFPLLFIQRGTPWNPIQFFYYSQFALGLFAARIISKLNIKYGILVVTVNHSYHY